MMKIFSSFGSLIMVKDKKSLDTFVADLKKGEELGLEKETAREIYNSATSVVRGKADAEAETVKVRDLLGLNPDVF